MKNSFHAFTLSVTLLSALSIQQASASLSITTNPNAPVSGLTMLNVGPAIGSGSFSGVGYTVTANTAANEGFVKGSQSGLYAAPVTGPASTYQGTYLSTGLTTGGLGTVTIAFAAARNDFSLLWGSIDATNELSFFSGSTLVGEVSGTDVTSSPNGSQAYLGSAYVNVTSSGAAFDHIVLTSGQVSFEAADFEAGAATPEPAFYGLVGAGLTILGTLVQRRRRKLSHSVV